MSKALSIIIPCFNADATLEEAVASCFRQDVADLEIILVDDGSTDTTRSIIEKLSKEHPEIVPIFHDTNKGGGAARNTGAVHASSDVLFFLDSDDLLPKGTLGTMRTFLKNKNADGVGIETSIKFRGTDSTDIDTTHTFVATGTPIALKDLYQHDGLCSLYSTFMVTKAAFMGSGQYPIHHGFDTQGFAWRFLATGHTAYTCPGATYLHRVSFHESYYLREAHAGRTNYNWFDILDEHFYLLSPASQHLLLTFPYDRITRHVFDEIAAHEPSQATTRTKESYRVSLEEKTLDTLTPEEAYWLGCEYLREGRYDHAKPLLQRAYTHTRSARVQEKIALVMRLARGESYDHAWQTMRAERPLTRHTSLMGILHRLQKKVMRFIASQQYLKQSILALYLAYQDIQTRLRARHTFSLIMSWILLKVQLLVQYRLPRICPTNTYELDVVIPTIAKDRVLLAEYLAHLRTYICGTIGTIYIVAPHDPAIIRFCEDNHLIFVDERSVLGYGKEAITYEVHGTDRRGWLFQQLLKLSGDRFINGSRYVIVDSDTLLLRPHAFIEDGKTVFFENKEWQEPYFRSFERLFGYEAPTRRSLTSHMMLFDVARLGEMKREIETRHSMSWDQAYIAAADRTNPSGISDYETYANWMLYNHPDESTTKPFYNKSLSRKKLEQLEALEAHYARTCASLSFHSYNA